MFPLSLSERLFCLVYTKKSLRKRKKKVKESLENLSPLEVRNRCLKTQGFCLQAIYVIESS